VSNRSSSRAAAPFSGSRSWTTMSAPRRHK